MHAFMTPLLILLAAHRSAAVYKRWTQNTDFENSKNWVYGLPCANDRIVFPYNAPVVAMNQDWTIYEVVLPSNGVLLLANDINLVFNNNATVGPDTGCPGHNNTFNNTEARHWLDPSNWCLPQHDFDNSCWKDIQQIHSEMVPCTSDDVIFPSLTTEHLSSFFVNLDLGSDVSVGTFQMGFQHFTTDSLLDYMRSDIGKRTFYRGSSASPSIVSITSTICVDPAGCYCGMDRPPLFSTICFYARQTCAPALCERPFIPQGHCCEVCGGVLTLSINSSIYSVLQMKEELRRSFTDKETTFTDNDKPYKDVKVVISRLRDGTSQILLVDNVQGQAAGPMTFAVKDWLENDQAAAEIKLGVVSIVALTASGKSIEQNTTMSSAMTESTALDSAVTSQATFFMSNSHNVAGIVLVLLVVIIQIILAGVCFVTRRRSASPSFAVSARFGESSSGASANIQGFNNPVYGSSVLNMESAVNDIALQPATNGASSTSSSSNSKKGMKLMAKKSLGFDNPVFFDTKTESVGSFDAEHNPAYASISGVL